MKFENVGNWMKEAEDKLVFDNREPADFLDGDDEICTLKTEDDSEELSGELLDEVESDEDELESPDNEEDAIVMSESMPPIGQRKRIEFEDDIVRVYDGNKEIYAGTEDYEPMQDEDWKWDNANKYYKLGKYIKVCCESSQKNEDFRPDDIVPQSKQMDFKKQYLKGKDARKINKNSFYFDGIHAVDDQSGSDIPGAVLGMKYKDLAAALDKFFESAQKNEAKLDKGYDISFDNIGGGFEVIQTAVTNGYGIELSGYSSNTGKKLTFIHSTLSNDSGLTQDERREHYDGLNAKRTAIAKDLKPLADKFDKDIEAVFAKHGFKKQ